MYISKETESSVLKRYLHSHVHCSIIHNSQWINKMWYIHDMEYHSALKREEILTRATTWINLEDFMMCK